MATSQTTLGRLMPKKKYPGLEQMPIRTIDPQTARADRLMRRATEQKANPVAYSAKMARYQRNMNLKKTNPKLYTGRLARTKRRMQSSDGFMIT